MASKRWPTIRQSSAKKVVIFLVFYGLLCLLLYSQQRQLIYRPRAEQSLIPSASDFNMPYEDVWISVEKGSIHGWWIPADETKQFSILENEPKHILTQPKVILYFCGIGNNIGDYNYLSRMAAFRQLGFSVLAFDYRGYGRSEGDFPQEAQLYADGEGVWRYLRKERNVVAEDIVLYGESMGGAIALNLAINHPEAGGLIMQSSFTSMSATIKRRPVANAFPINWLLTETFDSIEKIEHLDIPVLFIHGEKDSVVPVSMSHSLYKLAPVQKQLWIVPGADHVSIYRPGASYLQAIQRFIDSFVESPPPRVLL